MTPDAPTGTPGGHPPAAPDTDPDPGTGTDGDAVRARVRAGYAAAATTVATGATGTETDTAEQLAGCCGPATDQTTAPTTSTETDAAAERFGAALYDDTTRDELPDTAVLASLGCGNPLMVADLTPGETVLDLGSGGGIDVLLSARRVGPEGTAYGLDMTDEMLDLARRNVDEAGATNVELLKGTIEDIPLPDGSVDVIISNCVINLSADKPSVFAEMQRVLSPGGRIGIADVVAEDHVGPAARAERGDWVGCVAGALSRREYEDGLHAAGFTAADVRFTHDVADGMHGALVRATRPS